MNTSKKVSIRAILFIAITALGGCAAGAYPYGYGYGGGGNAGGYGYGYSYGNQPYYGYGNYGGYGYSGYRDRDGDRDGD